MTNKKLLLSKKDVKVFTETLLNPPKPKMKMISWVEAILQSNKNKDTINWENGYKYEEIDNVEND